MKKAAIALIVVSILVITWYYLDAEAPPEGPAPVRDDVTLRTVGQGDVVGFIDRHGAQAWLGVPYAAAPTGAGRWRAPEPPEPWAGVRDALAEPSACAQKPSPLGESDAAAAKHIGSEDCLYLNVWAPPDAAGLPVMFWIHGGGNSIGNGNDFPGAHLAVRGDVVVVTINYRLGPFGWFAHPALATGDPRHDSGNYGTLDVIRALEWTRDNVAAFGGDPGNVTVFGESAGAFDTLAMMASPLAKGLFHRAISQSGGFTATSMSRAIDTVEDGGHTNSAREIVNRLLVADGTVADRDAALALQNDMANADLREYLYAKTPDDIFGLWGNERFGMIDVPNNLADGHVLPDLLTTEIFADAANHNMVPVILGTNRDEPALFLAQSPEYVEYFLWIFPRLKDEAAYRLVVKYGALAWKARGVDELAELMSGAGNDRVFAYRFDWDEEGTVAGYDLSKALGAAHFLEVPFVFGEFDGVPLANLFESSPGKDALSDAMMSYWSQFAHAGDPGAGREGDQPRWLSWGSEGKTSIVLDTPQDRGIRMMEERVTRESVVRALATDPEIPDQRTRCQLYVNTFSWGGQFDAEEYATLGSEGCAQFDPETLASG